MTEKQQFHAHCLTAVEKRLTEIASDIQRYQEASNNDTKSSAGDKFETSRAMMELEKGKAALQLAEFQSSREVLTQINPNEVHEVVALGSVVECSLGKLFLSVGLGRMEAEGAKFMAISLASPIGKLLLGKKAGEEINLNGKTIEVSGVA